MTKAQEAALKTLAEAKFPVKLHAATGRSLERYGLVESRSNGYILTDAGRNWLANEARQKRAQAIDEEFPGELRERLELVLLWLKFTKRVSRPYAARSLIQALLIGQSDFSLGNPDQRVEARVRREVESAIQIVKDYEAANAEAIRIGGEVGVTIEAYKANPLKAARRQQQDIEAVTEDGVASLASYRKRRMVVA